MNPEGSPHGYGGTSPRESFECLRSPPGRGHRRHRTPCAKQSQFAVLRGPQRRRRRFVGCPAGPIVARASPACAGAGSSIVHLNQSSISGHPPPARGQALPVVPRHGQDAHATQTPDGVTTNPAADPACETKPISGGIGLVPGEESVGQASVCTEEVASLKCQVSSGAPALQTSHCTLHTSRAEPAPDLIGGGGPGTPRRR
jgi:hypothetical protein